jgi:hypothetical protein
LELPDVSADFFGICMRMLRNKDSPVTKKIFFECPNLEAILQCWFLGLGLEHPEAIKTHQSFFNELLKTLRSDLKQAGPIDTIQDLEETAKRIKEFVGVYESEVKLWSALL